MNFPAQRLGRGDPFLAHMVMDLAVSIMEKLGCAEQTVLLHRLDYSSVDLKIKNGLQVGLSATK
jgi:hypothetical protein